MGVLSRRHVLVHNIGHHDVYLGRDGEAALHRPSGGVYRTLGPALADAGAAGLWADGRGLRLGAPVDAAAAGGVGAPFDRALLTLLPAALDRVERELGEADTLKVVLVTSGELRAGSTPARLGEVLAAWCRARWAGGAAREVVVVHLARDAFHIDPAILHTQLHVPLQREAGALARVHGDRWRSALRVWLSSSTGTAAMVSGLVAALGRWSPTLLTVPNPRQAPERRGDGWAPYTVRETPQADVGRTIPLGLGDLDEAARKAVDGLREWRDHYRQAQPVRAVDRTDEDVFWHRKGRQEVLATVVVRTDQGLEVHRGLNLEVSLPTGSLCAERNAMGSALVAHPRLQRADVVAVAVVGLSGAAPRLGPCGACREWLAKVAEVNPELQVLVFDGPELGQAYVMEVGG